MNRQVFKMYESVWKERPDLPIAIGKLERTIGYSFRRGELLLEALTHPSFASPDVLPRNNRLEFLGDSVLGLVVATILMERHEKFDEGKLSRLKATFVKNETLESIAREIGLDSALMLGKGERNQESPRSSFLSDALEALIGAVYMDGGLAMARTVIEGLYGKKFEKYLETVQKGDFKTMLQEWTQKKSMGLPLYQVVQETGKDHQKMFHIKVLIEGEVLGNGTGWNKKGAEQMAAFGALLSLGKGFKSIFEV